MGGAFTIWYGKERADEEGRDEVVAAYGAGKENRERGHLLRLIDGWCITLLRHINSVCRSNACNFVRWI